GIAVEVSPDADWLTASAVDLTTPTTLQVTADPAGLAAGTHTASVTITTDGSDPLTIPVALTVTPASATYSLLYSTSPGRGAAAALDGASVVGDIYAFTSPTTGVTRVDFVVDDPDMSGGVYHSELIAPHDLEGGTTSAANPFDTTALPDGLHTLTALITTASGTEVAQATFSVENDAAVLSASPNPLTVNASSDDAPVVSNLVIGTGGAGTLPISVTTSGEDWLTASAPTGLSTGGVTVTLDPEGLATGTYTGSVTIEGGGAVLVVPVTLAVVDLSGTYSIQHSATASRANPTDLDGAQVAGDLYAFTSPTTNVTQVQFFLDDPAMSGAATHIENTAPHDFNGGTNSVAAPFDTTALPDGPHTITARIIANGVEEIAHAEFEVVNSAPTLAASPPQLALEAGEGEGAVATTFPVTASDGATPALTITDTADWLTVTPASASAGGTLTATADPEGLLSGNYTAAITVAAAGYVNLTVEVGFEVEGAPAECYPLECSELLVDLPYGLDFSENFGGIPDKNGVGTGFTYVQPTTNGQRYLPDNIELDLVGGDLNVTTTAGIQSLGVNSLDNALGVGIDAPSQITSIGTTIEDVPAGTGNYEQAGLYFGIDEDNYVKLVVESTPTQTLIEFLVEQNGVRGAGQTQSSSLIVGNDVYLELLTDPYTRTISARYSIADGPTNLLMSTIVPGAWFSFDAAGLDPEIGTRSWGGIMATHRNGAAPLTYKFADFVVSDFAAEQGDTSFEFTRTSTDISMPTAMVWGPDDRLYVTELMGTIHALTFDEDWNVVDDEVIETLDEGLTLGITYDPESTPDNVILWVSHSSPHVYGGQINSSVITRLSGPNHSVREDIITGLPRANANHAINGIHFGTDGRLYIAVGSNTGTGAPHGTTGEFGDRPEQPLSAALLAADVKSPTFQGECATPLYEFGIPEACDVSVFSSGLRNMYDFTVHSNGYLYGPNNGLGVEGTVPPSAEAPCTGLADLETDNPGAQGDSLFLLEEGNYYGHPNPYRDECVFGDGTFQGVDPLPNYTPAIWDLGLNRSADGIIEYDGDVACGALDGDLLITNYSVGDSVTRVQLSEDGRSVVHADNLVTGFDDPLPIAQGPNGVFFVGEFGGSQVTTVIPQGPGCWESAEPLPGAKLEAGGAAIGDTAYVVGGKDDSGPSNEVLAYDSEAGTWTEVAPLPGEAVEAPMVVAYDGKLYAFGGQTTATGGAVNNAAVYDPATDTWTALPDMPTARGGGGVAELGGLLYVAGGMLASGVSSGAVERFDPATGTWATMNSLNTPRDAFAMAAA
ncbi:MAG: kelch repeat-containing protein, partial [Demequina sp.]|uniref:kelch repeat-containing protein n=1 Tax=Demequina sp. TaxID=2050685 RepID=UPI003A84A056